MPSSVVLVQGTSVKISVNTVATLTPSPAPSYAILDCIGREVTFTGGTASEIDVTSLCSTAKEFRLGLQDAGTMSVTGYWKQGHPAHTVIRVAAGDKRTRLIEVRFEDGSIFRALA